jgi:Ca-activated chloride channel family protein
MAVLVKRISMPSGLRIWLTLAGVLFLIALGFSGGMGGTAALAQSGRNKKSTPDASKTTHPVKTGETPSIVPKPTPFPTPPPDDVRPEDVIRVASNLVSIPTAVVDGQGQTVDNLKLEDFQLLVDGQQKPISELLQADTPVRLALLFDNSSSVDSARDFEKQAATRFFRRVMRRQDQAAVYSVSTYATLIQPMTDNSKLMVQAIENLGHPEGATALFDGVVMAADYLKPLTGRHVIVLVTDGDDTVSDTQFEMSEKVAQAANCQIYVVQTTKIENQATTGSPGGSANLRALAAERRMEQYTADTGGTVYAPYAVKELDAAFTQIAADLASQYILNYYSEDEKFDGQFRRLTVRVLNRQDLRIRARNGYYTPRS